MHAGYKGEMVFCDKCLLPVMGFAWRLHEGDVDKHSYDLCFTHYNENEDPYSGSKFYCIIPSGDFSSKMYVMHALGSCMPLNFRVHKHIIMPGM